MCDKFSKRFLSVREAAEYLDTTVAGVWKMCAIRQIRFYKPTEKRTYIAVEDLEEFITSGKVVQAKRPNRVELPTED